jgi:hypothetical protein
MGANKKDRFLGKAVRDGKLIYTSVSQIKLFNPADDGCNRKWVYQYVLGKKPPRTTVLAVGDDSAEKLEHYLTTGENVLPPMLEPAKKFFPAPGPDLECEKKFGDMERAIELRLQWLEYQKGGTQLTGAPVLAAMRKAAGLLAGDVPIDGAADVRHCRQTYIDKDGSLQREVPGIYVVNIDDLKTVSRIHPHNIRSGENAGKVLPSYCKTDAEVVDDIQMNGYARHAVNVYPGMTHARLGLVYANKNKREAEKRMGLVSVERILERWRNTEEIVANIEQVAGAQRIEDVEPNLRACDFFVHVDPEDPEGKRMLKGCAHRYYCPIAISEQVPNMLGNQKETNAMSLFDLIPVVPPSPVPDVLYGTCEKCGASLSAINASKLPSGVVVHIICPASATPPPPPININPPDRPVVVSDLELAAPVPQQEIVQIQDPQLRLRVEDHARQHAEKALVEAKAEEEAKMAAGAAVWCSMSGQKIVISTEIAVSRKYTCACGKIFALSALDAVKEGDQHVGTLKRHKLKKENGVVSAASSAPPVPVSAPPVPVSAPPVPVSAFGDIPNREVFRFTTSKGIEYSVLASDMKNAIEKFENEMDGLGYQIIAVQYLRGQVIE